MATGLILNEKAKVPVVRSVCPTGTFSRDSYEFEFSPELVKGVMNYYGIEKSFPKEIRMSSAAEEAAIQLALERAGQDPRKSPIYNNLFGRNGNPYAWQWTETTLRIPAGVDPEQFDVIGNERYWVRQVVEGVKVVGEMLVPEGNGRIVTKWDEVFGIPSETRREDIHYDNHNTHFWFKPTFQEVPVARRASLHHDGHDWCLVVDAYGGHWVPNPDDRFRPVRRKSTRVVSRK